MAQFQYYNIYEGLTAVRVVSTTNLAGVYFNGFVNSGVGATLTVTATGVLTIDSVVLASGDFILLVGQTAANQNGIYILTNPGATGIQPILTRRADMQNIEQIRAGQYVSVAAGTVNAGAMYAVVEPLPAQFGVSNLNFNAMITSGLGTASTKAASDNTQPTVASVKGATTANGVAAFADTAGTVQDPTATMTSGFGLTSATGNLVASTGNVVAGSSGHAGTLSSFPGTAANGSLIIAGVNAGGAFNTTVSNGVMGQSTVYTIPDVGAATGKIVVNATQGLMKTVTAAAVAGGNASQTITDAFCTAISTVICNWNTSANAVSIQKVTPGAGSFVVLSSGDPGASTLGYMIIK
jgi:hypothetical protein